MSRQQHLSESSAYTPPRPPTTACEILFTRLWRHSYKYLTLCQVSSFTMTRYFTRFNWTSIEVWSKVSISESLSSKSSSYPITLFVFVHKIVRSPAACLVLSSHNYNKTGMENPAASYCAVLWPSVFTKPYRCSHEKGVGRWIIVLPPRWSCAFRECSTRRPVPQSKPYIPKHNEFLYDVIRVAWLRTADSCKTEKQLTDGT